MIRLYHGYISLKRRPTKHGNNLNQRKTCYGLCQCRELSFLSMVIPPGQPNDSCCHHLTGTPLKVQAAFLPCITLDTCSAYKIEWPWVAHGSAYKVVIVHGRYSTSLARFDTAVLASAPWRRLTCRHPWAEPMLPREDVPHVLRTKIKCKAPTIGQIHWYQLIFIAFSKWPHITLNSLLGGWSSQHRWRMCGAQLKMLAPTHLPHRWPSKRRSLEALWGAVTNRHKRRKKYPLARWAKICGLLSNFGAQLQSCQVSVNFPTLLQYFKCCCKEFCKDLWKPTLRDYWTSLWHVRKFLKPPMTPGEAEKHWRAAPTARWRHGFDGSQRALIISSLSQDPWIIQWSS